MKFILAAIAATAGVAVAGPASLYTDYSFEAYLNEFHPQELAANGMAGCPHAQAAFAENLASIQKHNALYNAGMSTYWMAPNANIHMTAKEFVAKNTGFDKKEANRRAAKANAFGPVFANKAKATVTADSINWIEKGVVGPVKNQGSCGSCWAFATATTLEARDAILHNTEPQNISTQQINSCSPNPQKCGGSGGCQGATVQIAIDGQQQFGGKVTTAEAYPYTSGSTGSTGTCKYTSSMPTAVTVTGYTELKVNDADDLVKALNEGPVAVSVAASSFFLYGGGIFDGCTSGGDVDVNHAVVAVGYTPDYWLIRNSWGAGWGEKGNIKLKRYASEPCGVDTTPEHGSACEGDHEPRRVCGECAVLSESVVPIMA